MIEVGRVEPGAGEHAAMHLGAVARVAERDQDDRHVVADLAGAVVHSPVHARSGGLDTVAVMAACAASRSPMPGCAATGIGVDIVGALAGRAIGGVRRVRHEDPRRLRVGELPHHGDRVRLDVLRCRHGPLRIGLASADGEHAAIAEAATAASTVRDGMTATICTAVSPCIVGRVTSALVVTADRALVDGARGCRTAIQGETAVHGRLMPSRTVLAAVAASAIAACSPSAEAATAAAWCATAWGDHMRSGFALY